MKGGMEYVRSRYGVPARPGGRVIANGRPGTIVGARNGLLTVHIDGDRYTTPWHPTWHMVYIQDAIAAAEARGAS